MQKVNYSGTNVLELMIKVLREGGLVMHPTETCYGFAVDVFNEGALEKLYKLKGRDRNKPVSILVTDLEMAQQFGEFSDKALQLAKKYWPGPLTIIVPRKTELPEFFNPGDSFVGIRCSADKICDAIVGGFGGPVTTTSANLSGGPPLYEADVSSFGDLVGNIDLLIDGGVINENKPSTVVKVMGDEVLILRQGDLFLSK